MIREETMSPYGIYPIPPSLYAGYEAAMIGRYIRHSRLTAIAIFDYEVLKKDMTVQCYIVKLQGKDLSSIDIDIPRMDGEWGRIVLRDFNRMDLEDKNYYLTMAVYVKEDVDNDEVWDYFLKEKGNLLLLSCERYVVANPVDKPNMLERFKNCFLRERYKDKTIKDKLQYPVFSTIIYKS